MKEGILDENLSILFNLKDYINYIKISLTIVI
jgi:hypothetical protein